MILADKRDYKRGYKKHYAAYKKLWQTNDCSNSRRLLLAYCVECGLKYKLLERWQEENPRRILQEGDERKKSVLKSHNLEIILKELGQMGNFKFPQQLKTSHQDNIDTENYHQVYRYGVGLQEKDKAKEESYEEELKKVAFWIEEGI